MAADIASRRLVRPAVLFGVLFVAAGGASAAPGERLPLPRTVHPDGFIGDDGRAFLVARSDEKVQLLVWGAGRPRLVELPDASEGVASSATLLPGNRLRLGTGTDDGSNHGGPNWTQIYSLATSGRPKLLWTASEADFEMSRIRFSPDGEAWAVLTARLEHVERNGEERTVTTGLHFGFGDFRSPKVRRNVTVAMPELLGRWDTEWDGQTEFISSDGPVVVTSYDDERYLLRFGDDGAQAWPVPRIEGRTQRSVALAMYWHEEDRLLWFDGHLAWYGWHLWDLGVSGFPESPALRLPGDIGRPHRKRGFVRTVRDGGRYRIEHFWQSPESPNWQERRVSEWVTGTPIRFRPNLSDNGHHALVFEQELAVEEGGDAATARTEFDQDIITNALAAGATAEDAFAIAAARQGEQQGWAYFARRLELSPVPVEPPVTAPPLPGDRVP